MKRGGDGRQRRVVQKEVGVKKHIVVPQFRGSLADANFVEDYIASLATVPAMDPSRPLWEVHVLNCKSQGIGAEACFVFRVHHCIGDCVSLTSLFLDSTTKSSEPESKPTVPAFVSSTRTRFSFRRIFLYLWSGILCFLCTCYELTHAIFSLLRMKDAEYFRRGTEVSNHRKVMAHASVVLQDISVVKKAL